MLPINKIEIKNLNDGKHIIIDDCIFSTNRLLIAKITTVMDALDRNKREILSGRFLNLIFRSVIIIQAMELVDDELSELEQMALHEVVINSFQIQPFILTNTKELSDDEARLYGEEKNEQRVGKSFRIK